MNHVYHLPSGSYARGIASSKKISINALRAIQLVSVTSVCEILELVFD